MSFQTDSYTDNKWKVKFQSELSAKNFFCDSSAIRWWNKSSINCYIIITFWNRNPSVHQTSFIPMVICIPLLKYAIRSISKIHKLHYLVLQCTSFLNWKKCNTSILKVSSVRLNSGLNFIIIMNAPNWTKLHYLVLQTGLSALSPFWRRANGIHHYSKWVEWSLSKHVKNGCL